MADTMDQHAPHLLHSPSAGHATAEDGGAAAAEDDAAAFDDDTTKACANPPCVPDWVPKRFVFTAEQLKRKNELTMADR